MSCVYRTLGSDVHLLCENFDERIFTDVVPRQSVFVCGDFNIDLMKIKMEHTREQRFFSIVCIWSRFAAVNI